MPKIIIWKKLSVSNWMDEQILEIAYKTFELYYILHFNIEKNILALKVNHS